MAMVTQSRKEIRRKASRLDSPLTASPGGVRFDDPALPLTPELQTPNPKSAKSASVKKKIGLGTQIAKQLMKGGKKGGQGGFRLEELDEAVLKLRLQALEIELAEYKSKCDRHKRENDWYREEIESCQRDTAEYIAYLESKKSEKQAAIDSLIESSKMDMETFVAKKKVKELENEAKLEELRNQIVELEDKIEQKQQEVHSLSDIMSRRARHESDIARLQREMHEAEQQHQIRLQELERNLLEERIKVQKETDAKIKEMESAAHEKAHKYLTGHISDLDAENQRLATHLRQLIAQTQNLLAQKQALETQNLQLQRDTKIREDLLNIRLQKVQESEKRRSHAREKVKERKQAHRKNALEKVVRDNERNEGKGIGTTVLRSGQSEQIARLVFNTSVHNKQGALASVAIQERDLDWSDDDDEYM